MHKKHRKERELEKLRAQIFAADSAILSSLAKRMRIVEKIGAHKNINKIEPLDAKLRDKRGLSWIKRGKKLKLPGKFIRDIFAIIHDHSVAVEKNIRGL